MKQITRVLVFAVVAVAAVSVFPTAAEAQQPDLKVKHMGPCRDPWINYAYMERLGRNPIGKKNPAANGAQNDFGECNCNLYAGCNWSSYQQLEQGVVAWNGYTKRARVAAKNVGGVFKLIDNLGQGTPVNAVIRNASGGIFDFMGNALRSYGLMSANAETLGNGTTIELK